MAKHGGKRPGAGRPAGRKDKATIEHLATIEELARSHTDVALGALVAIARAGESDAARVSAANALLDRGYGKPKQAMEHTGKDGGPIQQVNRIERVIIGADEGDDAQDSDTEGLRTTH